MRVFTIVALLFGSITPVAAQPWLESLPPERRSDFYAVRDAFESYWDARDNEERGKGWKPFKRWEWFWEQRVFPTGAFPDRAHIYKEFVALGDRGVPENLPTANWTELGPDTSPGGYSGLGRLNCVRADPADPDRIWVGAASGGLWRTTDAGLTWEPVADNLASLGVTDISFDPGNSSVIYIATGDGDAFDAYSIGVMKSTDGGDSWETTGLSWMTSEGILLNRVMVHPADPGIVLAAGLGIYRSTDGGVSWLQTSVTRTYDLEVKPDDPDIWYASGGLGNISRSTDAGATWTTLSNGLPAGGRRVALAVTPAAPHYLYALISNASSGFLGLYRSTDGGDTWTERSDSPNLLGWSRIGNDTGGQGWYDLAIAASPVDPDEIYTGGVNIWKSSDGGVTWSISTMWYAVSGLPAVHADQHDLFFADETTLYAGNDGGIYRTTDGGEDWNWIGQGLRITQFYRFGNSQGDADKVLGGTQDNGTKLTNNAVWSDQLGGDGMESVIDYTNALVMYGTIYYGSIYRTLNGGSSWSVVSGGITETGGWITPFVIDPVDPLTLYGGYQHVWKTTDRGASWSIISGFSVGTLSLLEISESDPGYLYAGNGGFLYRTTDGGLTPWTARTRPPGFGTISDLVLHPEDPDHIWASLSGYFDGQKVYESLDGGLTWSNISGTMPNIPVNCLMYQKSSPGRVYAGTDLGVWYRDLTTSDWIEYNNGFASVVVTELEMQDSSDKLRAATYGRGVWESDPVPNSAVPCSDIDLFLTRCNGSGTVQALVRMLNSNQYGGETITFLVDGNPYPVQLMTNGIHSIGRLQVPSAGIGPHTVTLVDPVGCFDPVDVTCSTGEAVGGSFDRFWSEADAMYGEEGGEPSFFGNYPNPFNPATTFSFVLKTETMVRLAVYDLLGREVAVLANERLSAGTHSRTWQANPASSGVYIARLLTEHEVQTRRITLMK